MTERTSNFNLIKLEAGDKFSAEDYSFSTSNIDTIDRALAQVNSRPGSLVTEITDPVTGPSLTLDDTVGNIPAGTTAYYRFAYVDELGAETAASPVTNLTTASPVDAPGAPVLVLATTGGTLKPGNYFYVLTSYVTTDTSETRAGTRATITVPTTTTTNEITLTLPSTPAGVDGFNVYRRGPGESDYSYIDSIDLDVATPPTEYVDDGSTTANCTRRPPLTNNTNTTNSIEVSIPGATPTVDTDAAYWRIYRTYDNTDWTSSKLTDVVEETFEGSGVITPTFTDLGYATTYGSPSEDSTQVTANGPIVLTDMEEVDGYLPVARNVIPHEVGFAFPGAVAETTGTFVWRCPFEYAEIQWVTLNLGKDEVCSGGIVECDVLKYNDGATPTWDSIFDAATPVLPTIEDAEDESDDTVPTDGTLIRGDKLVVDITSVTTASVSDLAVIVYMLVREAQNGDTSETGILGIS